MILYTIPNNHVLEGDIKKEPYWNRIPDTRFYPISCINKNYRLFNSYHFLLTIRALIPTIQIYEKKRFHK